MLFCSSHIYYIHSSRQKTKKAAKLSAPGSEAWEGYLCRLPGKLVSFACKGNAGAVLPAGLHIDCDDILHHLYLSCIPEPPCELCA